MHTRTIEIEKRPQEASSASCTAHTGQGHRPQPAYDAHDAVSSPFSTADACVPAGLPWTDLDGWRYRLGRAADQDAERAVLLDWLKAAGASIDGNSFTLPALPTGYAPVELRRLAARCGLVEASQPAETNLGNSPAAEPTEFPL
jgi:hypothetical protein